MSEKFKEYPEQSEFVKGKKVWLELSNEQTLVISPQARDVIKFYGIDEEQFIEKLKALLNVCANIRFPFHRISVSKASVPELSDEYGETVYLTINIRDSYGKPLEKERKKK
jgi:hypothetical protein